MEITTSKTEIFCLDKLSDGEGIRILRKFFHNIIKNFEEETFAFYNIWGEFPFIYSEKQIHSVLAPAIYKYTNNIWFEQPFKDYKNNQRFLDIVTAEEKNIYLIELKHSWNSKTQHTNQKSNYEWETAIKQIKDINRKTIKNYFDFNEYPTFKIAFMIMPTYLPSSENHEILSLSSEEYVNKLFENYNAYSKEYMANFIGVIKIKEPNKYIHEFTDDRKIIYPYISFIARIERV